jgi:hypothetical protein
MAEGNASYRTQTLKFEPIELTFDESVPFKALLRLWLTAFIASFVVWIVFFVVLLIVFFAIRGSDSGTNGVGVSFLVATVIATIVFWVALLLPELPEPIAEWKTLLEDKAAAATSAYAAIYGSLKQRRRIPVAVAAVRVRSDVLAREVVNNRLIIADRGYVVYVSVFEYGTSLYVGWMMWRNRRGYQLIGTFLKDLVGGFLGRTGVISQMLRTEKPRAMREAVHSAVREGVEVAVRGVEVSMISTFGQDIVIQDLTLPGTPTSSPLPPAAEYGQTSTLRR